MFLGSDAMAGYNNTLITDELLRLVTPVIPISEWKQIAYEAFNLTVNEVDAIESAQTRADVIFQLLHQAVQRDQMPAKVLKQKIEDGRESGVKIGLKGLMNIEARDAIPSNIYLMNLSKQLEDYDSFLVGYMGYTMEEVTSSMYLSQDHKICVLKMLSLWRCKDGQGGVKTVEELLSVLTDVLQRGPYKVLENVINDWWNTKATRSNVVTRNYMQTNMPVSNIEAIQAQLKNIYTNTLSTLCPLPWLEKAEDVQYNFDDVFIPLRTIDVPIQQKDSDQSGPSDRRHKKRKIDDLSGLLDSIVDEEQTVDQPEPSSSRDDRGQTDDLSRLLDSIVDEEQTVDLSGLHDKQHKKIKTDDQPEPSSSRDDRGQTDDQPGPSSSRDDRGQTDDLSRLLDSIVDEEQIVDLSGLHDKQHKKIKTDDQPEPSSSRDDRGQTDEQLEPSSSRDDRGQTDDQPGPSSSRDDRGQTDDLSRLLDSIVDEEQIVDLSGLYDKQHKKIKTDDQPEPSSSRGDRGQTDDQPGPSSSRDDRGQTDDQTGQSNISKNRTTIMENLHSSSAQEASMRTILVNGVEKMTTTSPRNILIQSVAGGGKSTLCNRLAYLWANNNAEIQRLDDFDLVFLIKVNLIQPEDKSIYEYIHRELISDVDNICVAIKDLRMLFIVDGYDELSNKANVVEDLLAKHVCPQSTVILTTRYGQTPALKYFSNGFGITSLSSDDVQTFLSNLPRSTDATLTQINLDTHPLGAILSTPLFLWFYYLLGEEVFKGVDVSSRTSLFTHIVDGILHKAIDRLKKTEAECREAVEMLEKLAYRCLCDDKLHFDKPLSDLTANLGLVKQSKSHLKLKSHTTYIFTHKSLAEYLTARYIVKQTDCDVVALLSKIPEVQDPKRRQASLILFFMCGLFKKEDQLMSLCEAFIPEVTSEDDDSHGHHLGLQCFAEMTEAEFPAHVMSKRVCEEVMCEDGCNQYCALGIKRLYGSHPTHIRSVALCECSGDFTCRFLCLDAARDVMIEEGLWQSRDSVRLCDVTEHSLQRLQLDAVGMTSDNARHISHYISRGTQLKELRLRIVWDCDDDDRRSVVPDILHHLSSHSLPILHHLGVDCKYDSDARALTTFLPHCTNLRALYCERWYNVVSESVEEEMWEVVVKRCRNLEEVRVWGHDSAVSCDRLVSVMRKLSEREGIQALKLRKIVRVDRTTGDVDYTEQVKHLLPALRQQQ